MAVSTVPMLIGLAAARGNMPASLRALTVLVAPTSISWALHETLGPVAHTLYGLGRALASYPASYP